MIKPLNTYEVWLITGSQHLYGDEILENVAQHSKEIAKAFDESSSIPVRVKYKTVVKSPDEVYATLEEANTSTSCVGVIAWMHTFSPAKMWIRGLNAFRKPLVHLHTQYNQGIPWDKIDMDFMNENQSAHGDREFGFMVSRLRKQRKVIVGHWKEDKVREALGTWSRVAAGWHVLQNTKVARIGENMREVAVTEGDKVEAQMKFGFSVNGYGVGDLVQFIDAIADEEVDRLIRLYSEAYEIKDAVLKSHSLKDAARIELGLKAFLEDGGFGAYTNTFEDLHGMKQLPGIASQRMMAAGYGFGAEGDWKTAAMLHAAKVMEQGLEGGTSFMEDYTYHFGEDRSLVLGSHMLEICPSIASGKPRCEVHPLGIGGKDDPARLVFDVDGGEAINVSLIDMGNRFRMIVNEVKAIKPKKDLPKLPVARVLWDCYPDMETAAHAWILAGGAHHTVFSKALNTEFFEDLAEMMDIELLVIDKDTSIRNFKDQIRWNEIYYHHF